MIGFNKLIINIKAATYEPATATKLTQCCLETVLPLLLLAVAYWLQLEKRVNLFSLLEIQIYG